MITLLKPLKDHLHTTTTTTTIIQAVMSLLTHSILSLLEVSEGNSRFLNFWYLYSFEVCR